MNHLRHKSRVAKEELNAGANKFSKLSSTDLRYIMP